MRRRAGSAVASPPAIHVAILRQPYLRMVMDGRKTVESRITKTPTPPFGKIAVGDRLFLKLAGGRFVGTAVAASVDSHADLAPSDIDRLARQYRGAVGGDDAFWRSRRPCRFATFIALRAVEPMDVGPAFARQYMKAWYVLPPTATPLVDVTLTEGAVRNGYVRLPAGLDRFPPGPCRLDWPDGTTTRSQINDRRHVGGRTWRRLGLAPGSVVRFVAVGDRRYRVTWRT